MDVQDSIDSNSVIKVLNKMSDSKEITKSQSKKSLVSKTDKNLKRYSETEKNLLYELFEKYRKIIDIRLRKNSYSSTKQCEVRECWELILKSFNEDPKTNERTMKQLQKFWLNAKLRRMIPNNKYQDDESQPRIASDLKSPKTEVTPIDDVEIIDADCSTQNEEKDEANQPTPVTSDDTAHSLDIEYVYPSNLIIRKVQTQHQANEAPESFQDNLECQRATASMSKRSHMVLNAGPQPTSPHHGDTNSIEYDHNAQNDTDEVLHENVNSTSDSNQEKIDSLRLQEMHNRVYESQLRCEVQKLLVSKAEEEYKHLQEMNKLRLQETKIRLKLLEQSCANGSANTNVFLTSK
ncbi:Regulatory protein zeste [Pseudolycoriella hygida]|uniref:Regulatory protein zeste n=1 Tax=Pseudolycoriella hygida TaxID=35572 RepID=A0A9Q0MRN1_9DIPT|nr:Regulatory protein zeste [Pseudolycoriella hygida]